MSYEVGGEGERLPPFHSSYAPQHAKEQSGDGEALSPELLLERFRLVQEVHHAIAALPLEYRRVLILRDLEGLPGEQVAGMLELPVATMKTRLHRARHMLRDQLRRIEPELCRQD